MVATSAYDPNGNLAVATDPLGRTTTFYYNALSLPTSMNYSDASTPDVTYKYDLIGNRDLMGDGTGTTTYTYDELDRLISVTSPGPKTVGYLYDLDGNRTRLTYPGPSPVFYTFNKAGQLTSLQDWAYRTVAYTYFPDGALQTATNPNGTVATYAYDNARRATDILHQQGTTTIGHYAYTLDAASNVTGLLDGAQASTYALDRLYRLTGVTGPDGARTYGYDPVGNRTSLLAGGTTTYTYDRADRALSMGSQAPGSSTRPPASSNGDWNNGSSAYTSNNTYATSAPPTNQTKIVELGNFGFDSTIPANATITGVTVSVEWKVSTTASIATLGARAYVSGSPVGTELVNSVEPTSDTTQSFTVPGLTRAQLLNSAFKIQVRATRGSTATAFTASLDAVSVTVDYTSPGTVTLTTDAVGNLVAKGADTFAYDQANRLTSATVGGATETYTYDGDGVRTSRTVGASPPITYVSDVNAGLPVTLEDGTRKYVWGVGLAYAVNGSAIEVYHTDRLGSVRAITDAAGAVTATYRTDEFGVPTSTTGTSSQPFRFTGEPRDATGLSYLRARYYDASIGHFMSRDPFAGVNISPLSLNRSSYVHNNPGTWSDPSGRILPILAVLGVAAVNFVVGAIGYVAANAVVNAVENKPLEHDLNLGDGLIAGVTGVVAGGVGGIVTTTAKRLALGVAIGCGSTLASQQIEPRQDNAEGLTGCVFGAGGALLPANNLVQSLFFGTVTSVAQSVSTLWLQQFGGSQARFGGSLARFGGSLARFGGSPTRFEGSNQKSQMLRATQ